MKVTHKEGDGAGITTATRYVAYANDSLGVVAAKPSVAAYDELAAMSVVQNGGVNTYNTHAVGTTYANKAFFEVPVADFTTTPEVVRIMQFPDGNAAHIEFKSRGILWI